MIAVSENARSRIIRDPAFAERLKSACDRNPMVPPLHGGRLVWVRDEMLKRFAITVSTETVRKWFWGEAKPRPAKTAHLAEMLGVDVAWLQIGVDPEMAPRERRARNALADGVVNLVAGLIQTDGGTPAFPEEGDKRAVVDSVDIYAIIKGANYALHIAMGRRREDAGVQFALPVGHENVIVLGVLRDGGQVAIYELTSELIAEHGVRRGSSALVTLGEADMAELRKIESFSQRL